LWLDPEVFPLSNRADRPTQPQRERKECVVADISTRRRGQLQLRFRRGAVPDRCQGRRYRAELLQLCLCEQSCADKRLSCGCQLVAKLIAILLKEGIQVPGLDAAAERTDIRAWHRSQRRLSVTRRVELENVFGVSWCCPRKCLRQRRVPVCYEVHTNAGRQLHHY